MTFNWGELYAKAQTASNDPVPDGPYHVSIFSADATTSSTGRPMIKLTLRIEDGQFQNRKLYTQIVLSPDNENALNIFFRNCAAFGIGADVITQFPPGQLGPLAQMLHGRHANAIVGSREYQGQNRNEVKSFTPIPGGMAAQPMAQTMMPGAPMAGQPMGMGGVISGPQGPVMAGQQPMPTPVAAPAPAVAPAPAPAASWGPQSGEPVPTVAGPMPAQQPQAPQGAPVVAPPAAPPVPAVPAPEALAQPAPGQPVPPVAPAAPIAANLPF